MLRDMLIYVNTIIKRKILYLKRYTLRYVNINKRSLIFLSSIILFIHFFLYGWIEQLMINYY